MALRLRLAPVVLVLLALPSCFGGDVGELSALPTPLAMATTAPAAEAEPAQADAGADVTEAPDAVAEVSEAPDPVASPTQDPNCIAQLAPRLRTDITEAGNRVLAEPGNGLGERLAVSLPGRPVWVIPYPVDQGQPGWYVTLQDGTAVTVAPDGVVRSAAPTNPGVAPEVDYRTGCVVLTDAYMNQFQFINPLPDTRVVEANHFFVALIDPTDRYRHGVLGDEIEAAGFEVFDIPTGIRTRVEIPPPSVIEGISPMLADIDSDGVLEVLVTLSNGDVGAWLAAYRLDGTLLAESEPIGQGRRWRNQLGVAPVGPAGEIEIVAVRTPHLGGSVEYFRLDGDRLVRVATTAGDYTSHVIGSRNLDMGLIVAIEPGRPLGVLVPTSDRRALAVVERTDAGVVETDRLDLPAAVLTNIAGTETIFGAYIAVGTDDNMLRVVSGCTSEGIRSARNSGKPGIRGDC